MLKLKSINFEQQQFQSHQLDTAQSAQTEWMIGRTPTCEIVLPSLEVSRVHGQIVYHDGTYHFLDVGSTSGSLLNGEVVPVNEIRPLHLGDLLQIGDTFLHIEELAPPLLAPAAAPLLPEQQWTAGGLLCRCCRIIDETPDVKTFCLVAEPPVLFSFEPGQFVNLELEIDGKTVIRPYSISSSPTRPYHLSITVKRVPAADASQPAGLVSNWLHDHLQVGDRVKLLDRPVGHFTCLPNLPPKLLFISAGSGITPMMSMSRWVQDTLSECDVVFLHSARTPDDIVFRAELESMAAQMANFHLAVTITQPTLKSAWMGLTGRIAQPLLDLVVPDLRDRAVFVCGPAPFMTSVRSTLEAMNFPMQHYQEESFGGQPAVKPAPTAATIPLERIPAAANGKAASGSQPLEILPFVPSEARSPAPVTPAVSFAQSKLEALADGSASILELAEQEGVCIPYSCRVGACGACKVRTSQGQVRYDTPPRVLTAADQQAGCVLACVAYPIDRVVVEA